MTQSPAEWLHWLQPCLKAMIAQLYQFCEINSGTYNLSGLNTMRKALYEAFAPIADEVHEHQFPEITEIDMTGRITSQPCGSALFIRKRPHLKRRILLCGHMDTVYSINHPFQTLTKLDENRIKGPGVTDMKGGLVILLHALEAFEKTPFAHQMGWDVFINADEEIGSPCSSVYLEKIATHYQAALIYEPAMNAEGTIAKNRKGSGKFTVIATGKEAHAGRAFADGYNAICYLAKVITEINALNGKKDGVTINVGKIAGGEALNIVPGKAVAKLDVRIARAEDENWVLDQFNKIKKNLAQEGFSLTIHGGFGRPVKCVNHSTKRLFTRLHELGKVLKLHIDWQDSGGCCDGNNLARQGLPVLDTLGARGGAIHSSDEYILLDSLLERAILSALLLIDLAQGGIEKLNE